MLPLARPNVRMVLRCDNSASEAAAWKGLSLANGLCLVLRQFCDLQRRTCISAHIKHVPGFLNDVADSLSRDGDPQDLGFCDADRICPPWREFLMPLKPQCSPVEAELSQHVPALLRVAVLGGSRWVNSDPSLGFIPPIPSAVVLLRPESEHAAALSLWSVFPDLTTGLCHSRQKESALLRACFRLVGTD